MRAAEKQGNFIGNKICLMLRIARLCVLLSPLMENIWNIAIIQLAKEEVLSTSGCPQLYCAVYKKGMHYVDGFLLSLINFLSIFNTP